jgi:hypothetical protein
MLAGAITVAALQVSPRLSDAVVLARGAAEKAENAVNLGGRAPRANLFKKVGRRRLAR